MKKLFTFFAAILCAASVWADASGSCGSGVNWTFTFSTGTLTISGTGAIDDYSLSPTYEPWNPASTPSTAPWASYWASIENVVIGEGVTSVGKNAFYTYGNITSVSLPSTLTIIERSAFYGCNQLSTIHFSEGLQSIEKNAFTSCNGLTSIVLPSTLTSLGEFVFLTCHGITSIDLPAGLQTIGNYAFQNCDGLTDVTVHWTSLAGLSMGNNPFLSVTTSNVKLHVPFGTAAMYAAASPWSGFNIVEQAPYAGAGTVADPYLISSAEDWNILADQVAAGNTYAGKFFRQTADISVTTMVGAGSWENPEHPFRGTYDGDGHTLTFTISSSEHYIAPFRFVNGATFKNLIIDGANTSTGINNAGLVGFSIGDVAITNCAVRATITNNATSTPFGYGNSACGGFYGRLHAGSLTFNGCLFSGQIVGSAFCEGGFVGWASDPTGVVFADCLFAPTALASNTDGTNTFYRGPDNVLTFTNTYYLTSFGTAQAKQAYTITAEAGLTIANAGTETVYNVSGITSYGTGIKYSNVLYGGNADAVSLNLSGSATGYEASTGTLSGNANPYTLTMSDANVSITSAAPSDYDITANEDPQHAGVYYSTFYHSAVAYELPAGVEAYVAELSGDALIMTKIAEGGQVIPMDNAVILKANSGSITLTPSDDTPVTFTTTNNLHGVDAPSAAPANCYVLSGHSSDNSVIGVGFYQYTGTLKAHRAYAVISGGAAYAPKKLRFVFNNENTATGVENVQSDNVQSTKVLRNGQLIIIRGDKEYNAQGQIVK